eukprot:g12028.t1 g12028   contig6:1074224-1074673(+)
MNLSTLVVNVLAMACFVATVAARAQSATSSYSHATSTWNPECTSSCEVWKASFHRLRFNSPTATVDQELSFSDQDWQHEVNEECGSSRLVSSSSLSGVEFMPEVPHCDGKQSDRGVPQVVNASARAAAVAVVSAAAIGSARHALEMICL